MLSTSAALSKDKNAGLAPMQHRHFATIATIISQMPDAGYRADMAIHFADELRKTNPRFDRVRFLAACGVVI